MVTPAPNPARFDGHWLRRRDMAALLGISADYLDRLVRAGAFPAEAIAQSAGGRGRRRFDAGKVLAARQQDHR